MIPNGKERTPSITYTFHYSWQVRSRRGAGWLVVLLYIFIWICEGIHVSILANESAHSKLEFGRCVYACLGSEMS